MPESEISENYVYRKKHISELISKLESKKVRLNGLSRSYSNYRLLLLVAEIVVFFILFFTVSGLSALISAGIFLAVFSVIAHLHNTLDNGIKKMDLWIKIKTTNLARLNLEWEKIPPISYSDDENINEVETDLNLAGKESLHQLINTGTSRQAKSLLRNWLNVKNPSAAEILYRQNLVRELVPLSLYRDKLVLNSMLSTKRDFDGRMLLKLLNKKIVLPRNFKLIFWILIVLAPLNILLFLLFLESILPAYWGITTILYIALFHFNNKEKERLLDEAEYISEELQKTESVFQHIEKYKYKSLPMMSELCKSFTLEEEKPSVLINRLKNTVGFLRIRKGNPFVWNIIRAAFPVDFYFRLRLNHYKNLIYGKFNTWFEVWYNLEALSSLANFSFLNPGYTFPEITDSKENVFIFESRKLGHPLIQKEVKISNDFSFNPEGEIAVITGSNMSGKSTFIRTIGTNLSLAYAGCVVNAEYLRISLFRLFTCIKVSDSVIDGISYFYAEVKRLKSLLGEIEISEYPVLFLIDEIFRGTNNVERLKGSSAFIKKLAVTNSIGAVATHDLELVKLSDEIKRVKNYHFREEIRDGKMVFDYKLNNGPCPTTNALRIMNLEGLPVD